jgi:hypothetical protein
LTAELENWNWQSRFDTLEEATEFLLDYCRELGPLAEELMYRSKKDREIIKTLTQKNKELRKVIIEKNSSWEQLNTKKTTM